MTAVGQKEHSVPGKTYLVQVALDNHQTEVSCSSCAFCVYFPVSLQQPGVKLPSTQAIHIYFPNQQCCWMGKMRSGSEFTVEWFLQGDSGCEGCRGACSLAMPQPVWFVLGWRLSPPQVM